VSDTPRNAPLEHLARILRHEVADLLQGLYSVTAILQMRLPETFELEKQLVGNLKTRAEELRTHLDGLTQLTTQPTLERIEQNLTEMLRIAVERTQRQHPSLAIHYPVGPPVHVWADPARLLASCVGLVSALAEGANAVWVTCRVQGEHAWAELRREGRPATPEQLQWCEQLFPNTHFSPLALHLALAKQWLPSVGGELRVSNANNGVQVQMVLALVSSSEALK